MRRFVLLALLLLAAAPGRAAELHLAPDGVALEVFTYMPAGCGAPRALLLVFHGVGRDADRYRDHAKPLADALCAAVAAPPFDKARFGRDLYQYGGVGVAPEGRRSIDLIAPLADDVRAGLGARGVPVLLLGHSAGAQFLDRAMAFAQAPRGLAGAIVANPSTWVLPDGDAPPFGLGGVSPRAYLEARIAVLLGGADTGGKELAVGRRAMAQGENRLERGRRAFAMAQDVARREGWALGWTEAEVPGVGHDAARMFASAEALAAARRLLGE